MNEQGASDLYLTVDSAPMLRVENRLVPLGGGTLSTEDVQQILNFVLNSRQKHEFQATKELNTSLDMGHSGRFRVNVLRQRQSPALVIRRIVSQIPTFEQLSLPPILAKLSLRPRGLILLTGMTGSGKSTTLASMIDWRNQNMEGHIITIEDPIEYFHEHKKSIVTQREIGIDTESHAVAMKNALRQRPDVILVGEIRDREVMEQALIAAETGHLCLATIHTTNAYQAIERIVNMFPDDYGKQIRLNLSLNLVSIISQRLLPSMKGGQVPALEVMLNHGLIRELIHKGEIGKIKEVIEQNIPEGMRSFDHSLVELYSSGVISEETALANSDRPADLKVRVEQLKFSARNEKGESTLRSLDTSRIRLSE
ncbi:MAG: PilT/PilU family type 4a pilus ATPase [Alphaproteobacteria bacterium]|nr:PilT/PilU family type 4a pilus ATPase [Alphaproteobacteria bacterium]